VSHLYERNESVGLSKGTPTTKVTHKKRNNLERKGTLYIHYACNCLSVCLSIYLFMYVRKAQGHPAQNFRVPNFYEKKENLGRKGTLHTHNACIYLSVCLSVYLDTAGQRVVIWFIMSRCHTCIIRGKWDFICMYPSICLCVCLRMHVSI